MRISIQLPLIIICMWVASENVHKSLDMHIHNHLANVHLEIAR